MISVVTPADSHNTKEVITLSYKAAVMFLSPVRTTGAKYVLTIMLPCKVLCTVALVPTHSFLSNIE